MMSIHLRSSLDRCFALAAICAIEKSDRSKRQGHRSVERIFVYVFLRLSVSASGRYPSVIWICRHVPILDCQRLALPSPGSSSISTASPSVSHREGLLHRLQSGRVLHLRSMGSRSNLSTRIELCIHAIIRPLRLSNEASHRLADQRLVPME